MIKYSLGTLIRVLVNIDLLDGCSVSRGDIGLIIDNNPSMGESYHTDYDYKILINNCELLVFSVEIESIS